MEEKTKDIGAKPRGGAPERKPECCCENGVCHWNPSDDSGGRRSQDGKGSVDPTDV